MPKCSVFSSNGFQSRRPSLRKIAETCNVSATTVSKALRDDPIITEPQRERIKAVAKQMRYRPNRLVDGITRGLVRNIAIIRSWDSTVASSEEATMSANNAAFNRSYCSIILNSNNEAETEARCLDLAMQNRVSGIIIAPVAYKANSEYFEELIDMDIPFVMVEPTRAKFDVPRVHADNYHMGFEVTRYLLGLGHRRIAHLGEPKMKRGTSERFDGYCAALRKAGLPFDENIVASTDFSYASGMRETTGLLQRSGNRKSPGFTAIVACNFNVAFAAIEALERAGYRVPEDVSVAGSGLYRVFPHFHRLKLTTFDQKASETGRFAANLLIDRITGRIPAEKWNQSAGQKIKGALVVGDSTRAIA